MAVHFAAGANYAQRTAGGFLNPAATSTVMMWAKFGSVPAGPNYQLPYALLDDPAVYTDFVTIAANHPGIELALSITGAGDNSTAWTPVSGVWYHVCWVQSLPAPGSSGQLFYVNGTKIGSTAFVNRGAFTIGYEMIGNDTFATSDIDLQYFRSWQSALTAEQIIAEMQSTTALVASPFMDTPLTANLNDISGNGRNWTLVGADSFVAGPTLPSNSSAATATAITVPSTITQDFGDGIYAWYTYASVAADLTAGFFPFATLSDTLTTRRYYGTSSSLTQFDDDAVNVPFDVPTAGGATWFFRVFSSPVQPTTDVTIISQQPPDLAVPIGAIGVNDDGNFDAAGITFPATFLSTTGATLAVRKSAAGESGTVLPTTGQVCLYDTLSDTANIYPPELGTPTSTIAQAGQVISTDYTTQFYVTSTDLGGVVTLSPSGTLGATVYAVGPTIAVMTPNRENTILYWGAGANGAPVKRWNLTLNSAMTDLAAGVANHRLVSDMLCLSDGTIIVGYDKPSAATDWFVRRYDPAGAVLNTYTFGATNRVNRMAMAIDDPDSFWVWLYLNDDPGTAYGGGVSRFVEVDVATGASLTTIEAVNFEGGVYRDAPSETPTPYIGHSFSCPFWIQRIGTTPAVPGSTEYLIRRERWFPIINQEQMRMFFSMLQIDLQAGNGLGSVDSTTQGYNPILELDWSDDGGWTWSNIHFIETGKMGQYSRRVIQRMLGSSRGRVFRIAVSDPVQWAVINGYMQVILGTS